MIPSGVILLMFCGCLFAGLMSNQTNHWQPARIYAGILVFVILAWSGIALIVAGVPALFRVVFGQ